MSGRPPEERPGAVWALAGGAALAGGLAAWSLFEAQWVECRTVHVEVAGLPPALDGLSILHLSDLHVGNPSFNARALRKAIDFGVAEGPDMVVVTGDIVNGARGVPVVRRELARLHPPLGTFASLGNHDVRRTKDPLSNGHVVRDWGEADVRLLRDRSAIVSSNGAQVEIAGLDPEAWLDGRADPASLFRSDDAFRILLAHYPDTAEALSPRTCSLVLSGHLHGGQICLAVPGLPGKLRPPQQPRRYPEGVFRVGETTLVVSRGTGTTLLPFRLMARPEASLLRLRATRGAGTPTAGRSLEEVRPS